MTGAEIVAGYERFRQTARMLVNGVSDEELHKAMLDAIKRPDYETVLFGAPEYVAFRDGPSLLAHVAWFGVRFRNDGFEIRRLS